MKIRLVMILAGYLALCVAFLVRTSTAFTMLNGVHSIRRCGNYITVSLHGNGQGSRHSLRHRYNTRRHMEVSVGESTGGSDERYVYIYTYIYRRIYLFICLFFSVFILGCTK